MESIKEISEKIGKSSRSVQRWIEQYNEENNTIHGAGLNDHISDAVVKAYIYSRAEKRKQQRQPDAELQPFQAMQVERVKEAAPQRHRSAEKRRKTLREKLSADWLVMLVLLVILWVDMFSFAAVGSHGFGTKFAEYSSAITVAFSIIGLATGIGSIVSYNRIKDQNAAEAWKWLFGSMQFIIFEGVVNEWWKVSEFTMAAMFVLVFIGVQRAIID